MMFEKRLQKFIKQATSLGLTLILLCVGACEVPNPSSTQTSGVDPQSSAQAKKQRIALVIGNSDYAEGALSNPKNDATDIANALKSQGIKVTLLLNQNLKDMDNAIANFKQQLSQGGVGIFYYAGHGVQVEGENYLVPIDARLESQNDVRYDALPVGKVLNAMKEAGTLVNVIMIDACRDNPFYRHWHLSNRSFSSKRGLVAYTTTPEGLIISFSTAPNDVAADGDGRNSPYTASILQHIKTPNQDVVQMFREVRSDVIKATKKKQTPWYEESLTGNFFFNPMPEVSPALTQSKLNSPSPVTQHAGSQLAPQYAILKAFLKAGRWKEADDETAALMLKVANREKEGWLDSASIQNFPCDVLSTIDHLWVDSSNGKFGFSVQKKIYVGNCGGKIGNYNFRSDTCLYYTLGYGPIWTMGNGNNTKLGAYPIIWYKQRYWAMMTVQYREWDTRLSSITSVYSRLTQCKGQRNVKA